mgnify:CR=1 FL=1
MKDGERKEKTFEVTSPMRDRETPLVGYLHNISNVETAQNGHTKYFTGTFQTGKNDLKKLVSFTPEKHGNYVRAANMDTPVKIINSTLSPGKSGVEILVRRGTVMDLFNEVLNFKKDKVKRQLVP